MSDQEIPDDPESLEYYIKEKIAQMKEALKLGAGREVSFYELQECLVEYSHVFLTLIALQNEARIDHQRKKAEFQVWWDKKYIAIKLRENTKELAGSKWCTAGELEAMVRKENEDRFIIENEILQEAEHKLSFMNHLIEMWKSYQFVLGTISSNIRAEVEMSRRG
jgi:hypothetical protein